MKGEREDKRKRGDCRGLEDKKGGETDKWSREGEELTGRGRPRNGGNGKKGEERGNIKGKGRRGRRE